MNCIIFGSGSDIAQELRLNLERDEWNVLCIPGRNTWIPSSHWDLLIVCVGTMQPIAKFFDTDEREWKHCVEVNAFLPLYFLRKIWELRNKNAKVVFMSGPNLTMATPTYTAYRAGKALLASLVDTLCEEYPDTQFHWFRTGIVKTKIHQETLSAGKDSSNYGKAWAIMNDKYPVVSHEDVYKRLKALVA